jgi:predicted transcriptional regulator of viral defense system
MQATIDITEHTNQAKDAVAFVRKRGLTRANELIEAGYSRISLTRLVRSGELQRLGKGLYAAADHNLTEWHDLAAVTKTVPSAVVALVSALAFHEIGTQVPHEIWIALPEGARKPAYPQRLNVTRFSEPYLSAGVGEHVVEGVNVRVYGPAKTVADCFRMRSKVGYDVAIEALREGWRLRKFTFTELDHFARLNRVDQIMRPYIEAITA